MEDKQRPGNVATERGETSSPVAADIGHSSAAPPSPNFGRRPLCFWILLLLSFLVFTVAAQQYVHWRKAAVYRYYSTPGFPKEPWNENDARKVEVIQKSAETLNNLALLLLGGAIFLALRRVRPQTLAGCVFPLVLLPAAVSSLAFSFISGLYTLSSLVLVLHDKSPPMTDWRVQGYWSTQIEFALIGTVVLLLLFVDTVIAQWFGDLGTASSKEGRKCAGA